jgi:hypothetical protein
MIGATERPFWSILHVYVENIDGMALMADCIGVYFLYDEYRNNWRVHAYGVWWFIW